MSKVASVSNMCDSSSSDGKRKSSPTIFAAIAVCYVCLCGGNLLGFTSSAIPSMRGVTESSDWTTNEDFILQDNWNKSNVIQSIPVPTTTKWLSFEFNTVEEFHNLTDTQASWISGLCPLGAFLGSIMAPLPLNRMGPRGSTLFVASPLFVISWLLIAFAPVVRLVYAGRFLGGLAMGVSTSVAPVYIMDTTPTHLRGPLGTLPQCFIVVGVLTSFLLGSLFNWRHCAVICGTFVVPGIFLLIMTPESAKWLLTKRRLLEAQRAFSRLNGHSLTAKSEFEQMKRARLYYNEENLSNCEMSMIIDMNQNQDSKATTTIRVWCHIKVTFGFLFLCI